MPGDPRATQLESVPPNWKDRSVTVTKTGLGDSHIQFRNVRKSYDGVTDVVKSLNLEIARGEFVTLLGPSGSGKTTCLMMLAGFEALSGGDIVIEGRSVGTLPPQKRNIGMVFQSYALFPHMTIAENIAFPLAARGMSRADIGAHVARALAMIRLDQVGERRPAQLSGGQQQRVALARALVFEPSLVLMDEPLGALDKQLREEMQYEIMHLQQRLGVTVVYVTHDQTEALTMSNRIAVFNDGIIQQCAAPAEIYERPANAFVARFIGENNRIGGAVRDLGTDGCAVEIAPGIVMKALPVGAIRRDQPATLSIRPERIVLGQAAEGMENRFDATVEEVVFHGDHLRVSVGFAGQSGFVVKLPNGAFARAPAPGDTMPMGWLRRDCHALETAPDRAGAA